MAGIYYYFWHQELEKRRIGNHRLIKSELDDIHNNLGIDFIIIDVQQSLFNNDKYLPGYNEAYEFLKEECKSIGMKILPILSHGSGMIHDSWWNIEGNPQKNAFKVDNIPYKFGDGYWMGYTEDCFNELIKHQKFILSNISPKIRLEYKLGNKLENNNLGICEVMEDVGYPRKHDQEFCDKNNNPDDYEYRDSKPTTEFVKRLVENCNKLGYYGLYHAFRGGVVNPPYLKEYGISYEDLSKVCDGQIDTVAPERSLKFNINRFKFGIEYLKNINIGKLLFITLSADKQSFDLPLQWNMTKKVFKDCENSNSYTDIIFYNYNEGYNVSTEVKTNQKHRQDIISIVKEISE